ncbi:MAG: YebC/PmpR family DNA-binding transcriptional regulator [Fimbriimonadia bacterium]|jgi:YebC/PmpR family DNA-binding regulatory protein
MAGHSKWHNIRIRKEKQDAQRGKIFTRIAREIIVAARNGGGDPEMNPSLRVAVEKAREANMPADTIKRNIQRGTGEMEGVVYEQVSYEGYGPAGVAVVVMCLTENRNRTVADVRHVFSKHGGNMSEPGSVTWQFRSVGLISVDAQALPEDRMVELAMEAGAEDLSTEDGIYEITTAPEDLHKVQCALEAAGVKVQGSELTLTPINVVAVAEADAPAVMRFMDALEDLDDVQNVYANFDIPDEVMAKLG